MAHNNHKLSLIEFLDLFIKILSQNPNKLTNVEAILEHHHTYNYLVELDKHMNICIKANLDHLLQASIVLIFLGINSKREKQIFITVLIIESQTGPFRNLFSLKYNLTSSLMFLHTILTVIYHKAIEVQFIK